MTLAELKHQLAGSGKLTLSLKITPKSSRNGLVEIEEGGTLRIKVTAAPEKRKANQAVCAFLAELFEVSRSRVEILSGETSTHKRIRILL